MIHTDMSHYNLSHDQTIHLVLIGTHRLLLDSVAYRLENETDFQVLLAETDSQNAIRTCQEATPEIVLVDLDLKERDAFDIAARINAEPNRTRIIFLANHFSDASIEKALEVEASGLLLKRESMSELITAIRLVHRGHFCFSGEIEQRLAYNNLDHSYSISPGTGLSSLTDRQREVLMYLALGLSVKEVARRLHLSNKSIDSHKYRIMNKLGINDRVKLARFAIREGLIEA